MDLALRLSPKGSGDSYLPSAYAHGAVITRRAARISAGVRELITDLEAHMQAMAAEFDRLR